MRKGKKIEHKHVTLYIYRNNKKFKIIGFDVPQKFRRPEIRLTMDYPEDLILIRKIVSSLPKNKKIPNLETIIKIIDKNKKLQKINSQYSHKNRKWL